MKVRTEMTEYGREKRSSTNRNQSELKGDEVSACLKMLKTGRGAGRLHTTTTGRLRFYVPRKCGEN